MPVPVEVEWLGDCLYGARPGGIVRVLVHLGAVAMEGMDQSVEGVVVRYNPRDRC